MRSCRRCGGGRPRPAAVLLVALAAAVGCDLENPTVITIDDTNPEYLINYAVGVWGSAWSPEMEALASDEVVAGPAANDVYRMVDATANLSEEIAVNARYALSAREHARLAIRRAEEEGDSTQLRRGKLWYGWFVAETARKWGDQPIQPGGEVLTQRQQYERALADFEDVIATSSGAGDSLRLNALAGIARLQWLLGREPVDAARLQAAIAAAHEVLADAPAYLFGRALTTQPISSFNIQRGWIAIAPHFADIPQPTVWKFSDATALWLIIAESHLLSGDLDQARRALESAPLLPVNHTRLGDRVPDGPPLTPAEVAAFVASLDEAGVRFAIDELYRENFFAQGYRNVGTNGGAVWPTPLPPDAY